MQKQEPPATVDAYIAAAPREVRQRLHQIRAAIRKAVPAAEEGISYRMPAYKLGGRPLIYFAAFKAHIGLYPMIGSLKATFASDLAPYPQSKGTVRFLHDKPLPLALISRIAKFRAQELARLAAATTRKPATKAGKTVKAKDTTKERRR